jgi:hypothetical protein
MVLPFQGIESPKQQPKAAGFNQQTSDPVNAQNYSVHREIFL